ncbi:MAG: LysR family transcriptional regulator [Peptoniphilaceae bacterium]
MYLSRLKTFLLLAELKNFTEVAEQLYISQPAVSKQIKALENDLGVPLFNRVGQKNHLTIYGQSFLKYAQEILNTYSIAREHILQLENLERGSIYFGATNFNGVYLIPEILSKFKKKFPKIKVNFSISSSKKLIKLLDNASIEFAILSDYIDLEKDKYTRIKVFDDELKLIVSSENPISKLSDITIDDIKFETFILKEDESSLNKFLYEKINRDYFKNKFRITNQEGIKEAVVKNLGISFMSEKAIKYEKKLGLIKSLNLKGYDLSRSINLVYQKNYNLTPAAEEFIRCIKIKR